ncbi:MAG: FAD dependent oxidoreductase [bacterium ADurb.Bin429]|nr:MAG: FAD dependent oxidoreductase [bacterium ADurb.Bin429]
MSDECQPATLVCRIAGYDLATLDLDAINRAFDAEVRAGRLRYTDASWNADRANVGAWLNQAGQNINHIHPCNACDSRGKTQVELAGRASFLRLFRFLRAQPGLEALRVEYLAAECGVRESATIVGKATVTTDDFTGGRLWDDAVCYTFYPIDLHNLSPEGVEIQLLEEGVVPTVPRRALLPAGSRNLLTAGRCIASDRLANSALRVQATCMATGQVAGALAALATQTGIEVEELPLPMVDELLLAHGAIIPERQATAGPAYGAMSPLSTV